MHESLPQRVNFNYATIFHQSQTKTFHYLYRLPCIDILIILCHASDQICLQVQGNCFYMFAQVKSILALDSPLLRFTTIHKICELTFGIPHRQTCSTLVRHCTNTLLKFKVFFFFVEEIVGTVQQGRPCHRQPIGKLSNATIKNSCANPGASYVSARYCFFFLPFMLLYVCVIQLQYYNFDSRSANGTRWSSRFLSFFSSSSTLLCFVTCIQSQSQLFSFAVSCFFFLFSLTCLCATIIKFFRDS